MTASLLMEMSVAGTAVSTTLTVMEAEAIRFMVSEVIVMTALPAAFAVRTPSALTDTTSSLDEDQTMFGKVTSERSSGTVLKSRVMFSPIIIGRV